MTVTEFLKNACKNANYSHEKAIFVVTKDSESFDACREFINQQCIENAKTLHSEEEFDEMAVEPIRTLWIQVNDSYTPRVNYAVACLVNADCKLTDDCLRSVNNAMTAAQILHNLKPESMWLQTYFNANLE